MSTLNNSNAYGFCNNIVSNVIIKTLASLKIKASKCTSTGKNFTTVEVSIPKIGKVACLAGNVKNNALALSMHHMMNCKNIGFIYNGKLYIINQLTLQSNWANLITKRVYMYTDGVGTDENGNTLTAYPTKLGVTDIPDDLTQRYDAYGVLDYHNKKPQLLPIGFIDKDGVVTSIVNPTVNKINDYKYFDITGRYVGTDITILPAGLYIRNDGMKILK